MDPLSGSNKSTQLHPDFSLESRRDRRRERSSSPIVPISSSPVSSPPQKKERKDFYDFSRLPAGFARPSASPSPTQSRAKKEKSWQERAWDRCWDVQGEAFTRAIDNAEGKIDLSGQDLSFISPQITDLQHLTVLASPNPAPTNWRGLSGHYSPLTAGSAGANSNASARGSLSPPTSRPSTLPARPFARSVSAPVQRGPPMTPSRVQSNLAALQEASADATPRPASPSTPTRRLPGEAPAPRELGSGDVLGRRPMEKGSRAKTMAAPRFSQAAETRKSAEVELTLSGNTISVLPTQLFELKNLTHLNLRNNHLETLPAAISTLTNLTTLIIGGNRISYLPASILDMTQLKQTLLTPNPFLRKNAPTLDSITTPTTSTSPIPSLRELSLRVLLMPDNSSGQPPLLWFKDSFDLSTVARFHDSPYHPLTMDECAKILAFLRSSSSLRATSKDPYLEDASRNAFYSPCPNPDHVAAGTGPSYYLEPMEERFVWQAVWGSGGEEYPIKYEGCSRGCLAFLNLEVELGSGFGEGDVEMDDDMEDGWDIEGEDLVPEVL